MALSHRQRKKKLEAKLTPQQRKAALLLVENDILNGRSKTQEEIAQEVGITRQGLYKWRYRNKDFIDYMNLIADEMLEAHRAEVYNSLLKLIRGTTNGAPSIKAIDTYLKRFGLLTERQIIEADVGTEARSNEDLEKELAELDAMLNEDDDAGDDDDEKR